MESYDPIDGRLAFRDRAGEIQVKGSLVVTRPNYVQQKWGAEAWQRVLQGVSPETRALMTGTVLPFRWYPYVHALEVDRRIIEGPMDGQPELMKDFGSWIAKHDLASVYKILFKLGTPGFILKRANIAYSTFVRGGTMQSQLDTPTSGTLTLRGCVFPAYFCRYGLAGWMTGGLEMSGARSVSVEHTQCVHDGADLCHWAVSWG